MKASELIVLLAQRIAESGDLEVRIHRVTELNDEVATIAYAADSFTAPTHIVIQPDHVR